MKDSPLKDYEALTAEISERYPTLSKRLGEIASFALEHPTSMALETIANIAKTANVQPSALIRFAKAFGFSGFSEMQRVFQGYVTMHTASYKERISQDMIEIEEGKKDSPYGLLSRYCRENIVSLEHLQNGVDPNELDKAVQLMKEADHIYLIGQRHSLPISTYLSYALSHAGCKVHLLDGIGGLLKEQVACIGPKDLLIVTSFHPYSEETMAVVDSIKEVGTPYIAISDNGISPIVRDANVSFNIHDAQVHTFRSLTATMLLAQTLATSLLFTCQS